LLTRLQLDRRTVIKSLAYATAASVCGVALASEAQLHGPLPAWSEGHLDIHHIDTGRGNSALLIFPDGTTLLIDAGAAPVTTDNTMVPARPDGSRRPGEWIARYVLAHAPSKHLDYFLATHIHPDHVSGLADVQSAIPVAVCIDRGFPNYAAAQQPVDAPFTNEYLSLLHKREQIGQRVEAAEVGSTSQIVLRNAPQRYPGFSTRILAANSNVWNPRTQHAEQHFNDQPAAKGIQGNENLFSIATRLSYGPFSYFSCGDLSFDTHDGRIPDMDIESPTVRAAGRTEVALADHHGYFDACGPNFTNTLDAQVYIIPSWDIGHPGSAQMQRMLGAWDTKATHDVFALDLLPANALNNRRFAPQLKSQQGHVVVRVSPGGKTYLIYTLDSTIENGKITGIFGPYMSRS
jgi:hypothetical protein